MNQFWQFMNSNAEGIGVIVVIFIICLFRYLSDRN